MKVYLSCHHPDPARELAERLRAAGHQIVSDWHEDGEERPAPDDVKTWCYKAGHNLDQIKTADVLVLIAGPVRYPGGKFVEAGFAYGIGVNVIALGRRENGMSALFGFADDAEMLVNLLAENS